MWLIKVVLQDYQETDAKGTGRSGLRKGGWDWKWGEIRGELE